MAYTPTLESMASTSDSTYDQCAKKIDQESGEALSAIAKIQITDEANTIIAIAKIYLELADIEFQVAIIQQNHLGKFEENKNLFYELRLQISIAAKEKFIKIDWDLAKEAAVMKYRYRLTAGKNEDGELKYFLDYCQENNIQLSFCDIEV